MTKFLSHITCHIDPCPKITKMTLSIIKKILLPQRCSLCLSVFTSFVGLLSLSSTAFLSFSMSLSMSISFFLLSLSFWCSLSLSLVFLSLVLSLSLSVLLASLFHGQETEVVDVDEMIAERRGFMMLYFSLPLSPLGSLSVNDFSLSTGSSALDLLSLSTSRSLSLSVLSRCVSVSSPLSTYSMFFFLSVHPLQGSILRCAVLLPLKQRC